MLLSWLYLSKIILIHWPLFWHFVPFPHTYLGFTSLLKLFRKQKLTQRFFFVTIQYYKMHFQKARRNKIEEMTRKPKEKSQMGKRKFLEKPKWLNAVSQKTQIDMFICLFFFSHKIEYHKKNILILVHCHESKERIASNILSLSFSSLPQGIWPLLSLRRYELAPQGNCLRR